MALERTHILIGSGVWQEDNLREDCELGETCWTINTRARIGDRALFYLSAPIGALTARGIVASAPRRNTDQESGWAGYFMAHIAELELLPAPVSRRSIMTTLPQWRYWLTPVRSCEVPEQHLRGLLGLIKDTEASEEVGNGE